MVVFEYAFRKPRRVYICFVISQPSMADTAGQFDVFGQFVLGTHAKRKLAIDRLQGAGITTACFISAANRHAEAIGKLIAERAIKAGVKDVVFDRGGYLYHGRVKALADAAREGGLNF